MALIHGVFNEVQPSTYVLGPDHGHSSNSPYKQQLHDL